MSNENEYAPSRRNFINKSWMALLGTSLVSQGVLFRNVANADDLPEDLTALRDPDDSYISGSNRDNFIIEKGGSKPIFLPKQDVKDPMTHSIAENLFWNDIMMEHSMFFALLMPGTELTTPRQQALRFQKQFAKHLSFLRRAQWTNSNYKQYNSMTIQLVKPLVNFKLKMLDLQTSGKLKSLVWPTFFDHTIREAQRFISRLEQLSQGTVVFERTEVASFWGSIMGEHSQFMAHLLDPQETELIEKANQFAKQFFELRKTPDDFSALSTAGEEIIDFKTAAEKGIETGKIKSIIHPALADHVRREAVKYVDELKRSKSGQ